MYLFSKIFSGVVWRFLDFISFFWWRLEIDFTILLIAILTWWITALYKKTFNDNFRLMLISLKSFFSFRFSKCLFSNSVSKIKRAISFFSLVFPVFIANFTFAKVGIRCSRLQVFINLMSSCDLIIFVSTFSNFLPTFKTPCPYFF